MAPFCFLVFQGFRYMEVNLMVWKWRTSQFKEMTQQQFADWYRKHGQTKRRARKGVRK